MVVRTRCKGRDFVGLLVGETDVRRYFPEDTAVIELQMDHLHILCGLGPDFWQGQAEIRDPRLAAWLTLKNFSCQPGQTPVALAMIPAGNASFRLRALASSTLAKMKQPAPLNAA